ncbi:hypothetical protein LUZ60_015658 [Juncus effusus]|nr:hypothetical protein LUZ60_015658 [Juncus effusus]
MENKEGQRISLFDYSVEKFISPIYDEKSSIDELELERFRSMITFLREWKHFRYEPRNLSFFTQSKDFDSNYQFELPQFSSASVPQVEQLAGESKNPSSDYVLCAGGNVWALDWCPKPDNKPDPSITCEYLAVSAHPPGSNYHKMGAPLSGRGAIQIWCINTKTEKLEASNPKNFTKKGRPKKDPIAKNPNGSEKKNNEVEGLTVSKPRGRPKKLSNSDQDEKKLKSPKKKGRPRKRPLDEDFCINTPQKRCRSENSVLISVEIPPSVDSSETLLALPPPEPKYEKSTKKGTKMKNSQSNEKRPRRQVKSIYLRNSDEELITSTSTEVDNYENTLPLIIEPLDVALPRSALHTKKPSKRKKKEKPRKNQDSSPVSCLTTFGSATRAQNSPSVEREMDQLAGGPGPCEEEELAGGPGPCEKEELAGGPGPDEKEELAGGPGPDEKEELAGGPGPDEKEELAGGPGPDEKEELAGGPGPDEKEELAGGPGPCEEEELDGGPGPDEKEELTSQQSLKEELPMPSLVFCLAHNGKVAWDIKWKPITENNMQNNKYRMGHLAVLLGNGSLEVWDVPLPTMVQKLYSCKKNEGLDPRFIKLKPVFRCSKLKCGERQSIPLTLEWSTSPPNHLILAGCHDGSVALWKFSVEVPSQDSKPMLFITADSVPIRSLCWAPNESDDTECSNLFVTAGEGIKFWDKRDPYRPLWDLKLPHKSVMCVDWLKNPRCVVMSLDDGTVKFLSIPKAANDLPVTGSSFNGKKYEGLFSYTLSLFNIWSVHVSRATGCVAYSVADGSAVRFQLNERFLEKDPARNRVPYFLCGSFKEDKRVIEISISDENNSLIKNLPLKSTKGPSRYKGDEKAIVRANLEDDIGDVKCDEICDAFPSKLVAVHKIRWNMNKGCERWLCYSGAAGIIRVQKIPFPLS